MHKIYLIDGIKVPIKTWKSRQIWGESAGAWFTFYEIKVRDPKDLRRTRS
jgi:hypothetical protein